MKRKWISQSSSSASTSSSHAYDVFLNFRGSDFRYSFIDCLYEFLKAPGIRVFMDDEALRVGDDIGNELLVAIDSSRLYVPIFSKNYASSKWCLIELARMVECSKKSDGKEILPVFLDVKPEDVKLKTDLYAEDLHSQEERFGQDTVQKWREALRKVSEKKGWNWHDNEGQGKLIRQIAEDIHRRLELKHRILADHFIGMEEQIQDIMNVLDCGSRGVRIVVIHGMGGIGKTTLAEAIFNKIYRQFQCYSFLSNVRESSAGNGIVNLQNKLLGDTLRFLPHNFCDDANDAMKCIQRSLIHEHVLVVLDDVSDMDQIRKLIGTGDWVGKGSRVIITTRNLNCIGNVEEIENNVLILQEKKIYIYQMRELDFDDSLQLLCWHAFGQYVLPHGYEQLSRDVISLTKGIPLALEVIGSFLQGKDLEMWKYILNKLKKVPDDRLYRRILMTSYEALRDEEKEIFLDIAFFFSGHDKTTVSPYWEACDLFPKIHIDILVSYALVKIDYRNRIWMHDLLKDLGREVVRKQSIGNLEMRSRLCNEDAQALLLRRTVAKDVKSLKLDSNHAHNLTPEELSRLSGLRFLELCRGNFTGEFNGCLSELRWFSWEDCPQKFLGTNFCFQNLVVLRLSDSKVTDTWAGWGQFKTAKNLKVLELKCLDLTTTPDLSTFLSLERLEVRDCKSLVHIDHSIGNPKSLDSLELINTQEQLLYIAFPEEVLNLPSSICNLKALTKLVISGIILKQLPESIGELKGLKIMEIKFCRSLQNLPDSIGDLESLCKLKLSGNRITELPESIGKLMNLTELHVSFNRLRRLPATIGDLDRLEVLAVGDNCDLEIENSGEFNKLQSLRYLDLTRTGICKLPTWIVQLSRLESLLLGFCNEIQELPDLPTSLTRLDLTKLDGLRILNRAANEYLWDNPPVLIENKMDSIQPLQKMEDLSVDLSTELDQLSPIKLSCQNFGLESLENLTSLVISMCGFLERVHISRLQKLQSLYLHSCPKLVEIGGLARPLDSLNYLSIMFCNSVERLPARSDTKSPSKLHLDVLGCSMLRDYEGPYDGYFQGGEGEVEEGRNPME